MSTASTTISATNCRHNDEAPRAVADASHLSFTENRFGTRASRLLVTHVNSVELEDELISLEEYVLTDLAHAVMLTRTGNFGLQNGRNIVQSLLDFRSGDTTAMLASDPEGEH